MRYTIQRLLVSLFCFLLGLVPLQVEAQLRVVSYNTLDKPVGGVQGSQFDTIFAAIAATDRNGVAKRVDVISLQEQSRVLVNSEILDTSQNIAARLNSLHGVGSYQARIVGSGEDRVGVVYDSSTVALVSVAGVDTTGVRPAQLARFRPIGYSSPDAEWYLYGAHFNASSSSARASEATGLAMHADALATTLNNGGSAANFVFAGDYNFGSSFESGYNNLTATAGVDPLALGSWPNSGVAEHMTQSTRTNSIGDGGATGGVDDRFDLQLVTDDLLNGEGLSYLGPTSAGFIGSEHSYQAFGNDGVSYNQRINNTFSGRSQPAAVLNALHDFSDHLPVVADYQLPAVMEVLTAAIPETLNLGEAFSLDVTVRNAANVVAAIGADELDYVLSTSGDVTGDASGSELALAAGALLSVAFDTSTIGLKSGMIEVSTSSLAAQNSLVQIPISYEVVAAGLAGDFNEDGIVDAIDYAVWREGLNNGEFTSADFEAWQDNYGASSSGAATASQGAPEPRAMLLVAAWLALGIGWRRGPKPAFC